MKSVNKINQIVKEKLEKFIGIQNSTFKKNLNN